MNRAERPPATLTELLSRHDCDQALLAALRERRLPELHFYQSGPSVRAWTELCSSSAYRGYARSFALVDAHAQTIASALPDRPIEVVSLGAGDGAKDLRLLRALASTGRRPRYTAIDASYPLLAGACAAAIESGYPARGIRADLLRDAHCREAGRMLDRQRARLCLLLGGNIGAWDPGDTLRLLRRLTEDQDYLLIDAHQFSERDTLPQYDNPTNRRFALAPLRALGLDDSAGDVHFRLGTSATVPGLALVEKCFEFVETSTVSVGGARFAFRRGDSIRMSSSGKFQGHAFALFLESAGFRIRHQFGGQAGGQVLLLAQRRGAGG
ncbi:MAG: L-histidine N(alpha)-methyltransferase [Rhodocyclaceae bacterium]|nr:L-histidine N(alpha)-methyltransferase [Rhodocyclaceae bacterium]